MWCRHCQQDVPAVVAAGGAASQRHCGRCHRPADAFSEPSEDSGMAFGQATQHAVAVEPAAETCADEVVFLSIDGAHTGAPSDHSATHEEARYQRMQRTIRAAKTHAQITGSSNRTWRLDQPLADRSGHSSEASRPLPIRPNVRATTPAAREPHQASQWTAWLIALLGTMILGSGIGLLGWSLVQEQPDLWNWGLAAALSGQGLIIIGLVQLLANLWHGSRNHTQRLTTLLGELRRLQQTTDTLVGMRTASASGFYAELARGANPQVLLSSLKGQVDEIAGKIQSR